MKIDPHVVKEHIVRIARARDKLRDLNKNTATRVIEDIEQLGTTVLEAWGLGPNRTKHTREDLEGALQALRAASRRLRGVNMSPEENEEADDDAYNYGLLVSVIFAVDIVSAVGGGVIGKHAAGQDQAALARMSRSRRPAEVALVDAIKNIRGADPSKRPSKEANRILDHVNEKLVAAGHKPVKVDKVRRRLVKFMRS